MNNPLYHMLLDVMNLDGITNFIVNSVPYGESMGDVKEILQERFDAAGAAISDKSSQMLALLGVFAAPIVIALFLFIGKMAYDLFTGTADSIGDAFLIARYKVKTFLKFVFTKIRSLISSGT